MMLCRFDQEFGIAQNDRQQVVEVVGDPAGELPDGLHFLRLPQLLFHHFGSGVVGHRPAIAGEAAVPVEERATAHEGLPNASCFMRKLVFKVAIASMRQVVLDVLRPARRTDIGPRDFPLRAPDDRGCRNAENILGISDKSSEAELFVHLPEPVRRYLREIAELSFLLPQRRLELLALRNVEADARQSLRRWSAVGSRAAW